MTRNRSCCGASSEQLRHIALSMLCVCVHACVRARACVCVCVGMCTHTCVKMNIRICGSTFSRCTVQSFEIETSFDLASSVIYHSYLHFLQGHFAIVHFTHPAVHRTELTAPDLLLDSEVGQGIVRILVGILSSHSVGYGELKWLII